MYLFGLYALTLVVLTTAAPVAKRDSSIVFAPYIDVGAWPTLDPIAYKTNTGATHFMLAFVTADSSNMPTFAGNPTDGSFFASEIAAIRAQGGDVCISFGGASGTELANVAKDATALANQYLAVLNAYKATCADFDIEGASIAQPASVDLRNQAIAILKKSLPELYLSYTLPVLPTGLDYWGVALIASVAKYGAKVDLINIMAMDYGGPSTQMGTDAINAAVATRTQILAAGLTAKVGVTPMTGVNDVVTETFTVADMKQLTQWAMTVDYVAFLSFWSANRDTKGGTEEGVASIKPYAFGQAVVSALGGTLSPVLTTQSQPTTTRSTSTPSTFSTAIPSESTQGCYSPWSPAQIYTAGDLVTVNGLNYQSDYWTQNVNPSTAPQYGGWHAVGNCVISSSSAASTTPVGSKATTTASAVRITTSTTTSTTSTTSTATNHIATTSIAQTAVAGGASCSLANSSQCVSGTMYYCHGSIWEIWYKGC